MTAWTVVIPIKPLARAKSRLQPLDAPTRAALARAFALDTVDAALGARSVRRVIVVGRPDELSLLDVRVEVVAEPAGGGLGSAVAAGVAHARRRSVEPTAVLLGDLPALAPAHLERALREAAQHPLAFVPDVQGHGTTLATANAACPLHAHFGPNSAARHRGAGFVDLTSLSPTVVALALRTDVDTADDLETVGRIGPGARTAAVLRRLELEPVPSASRGRGRTGHHNRLDLA
ncbi:2-phospho-L-lactate guanylyltransferase [Microbacterium sp. 2FI]|uniref:2-phospho-L-lactate guanylyltransferase n=1 Tax=Microbacterium sp. 2FI TaxID=2502193 RepID=UPI0010F4478C|nr:2-phospho-L-lactate guanylyltransferase [Microbacterium sp. 2FI]